MMTDSKIASLKPGEWLRDEAPKGAGRLLVRRTLAGATVFYFRYTLPSGKRDTLPLGTYDAKGKSGLSLREARQQAGELSRAYQAGSRDIRAYLEQRQPPAGPGKDSSPECSLDTTPNNASDKSLKALLDGYCGKLQRDKKVSARQVRNAVRCYVFAGFGDLCQRPARDLVPKDFHPIFEGMIDRGITRQTAATRTILHAAYQAAMRAENDPTAPKELKGFDIVTNPISAIPAMSQFNVPGERALSRREFALYLREVRALTSQPIRTALLVAVLLGGQRMQQLLRLEYDQIDTDGFPVVDADGKEQTVKTLTLFDGKGRRTKPRRHVLPLFGEAERLLDEMRFANPDSAWVFTSDGKIPMVASTPSQAVCAISKKLMASKEVKHGFKLLDIRRTCETLLAKLKVHKDIRAQIQSHGLGGVQDRHYDKNEYVEEKYLALAHWVEAIAQMEAALTGQDTDTQSPSNDCGDTRESTEATKRRRQERGQRGGQPVHTELSG